MDKKEQFKQLIKTDPDFIYSKKYDYNINKLLTKYGSGCNNKTICNLLILNPNELSKIYNGIILKLKGFMGLKNKVDINEDIEDNENDFNLDNGENNGE